MIALFSSHYSCVYRVRVCSICGVQQNTDYHGLWAGTVLYSSVWHRSVLLHLSRHASTTFTSDLRHTTPWIRRVVVFCLCCYTDENQQNIQVGALLGLSM